VAGAPGVVLVVGDVIDDVIVRPRGPIRTDTDTPADIAARPGGSGANQAAWLAVAGARVRFVGRVGAADVARHAAALTAAGVEPVLVGDPDRPTGTIVILVADGVRTMLTDRGANVGLTATDLPDAVLEDVGLLLLSGYALFHPGVRAAVTDLARRARARGIALAVDPASTGFLADVGPATFLAWLEALGGVDLLLPNRDEARLLAEARGVAPGTSDPAAWAGALLGVSGGVVVTLGAEGALVVTTEDAVAIPAVPVEVVDPTGAGDAFAAGLIAGLVAGLAPVRAAAGGCALAARAVAHPGARP
jgi:sugar/nucleoside kinase (ribokinase family)